MYSLTLHWAPRARRDAVCYTPVCSSPPQACPPLSLSTDASVFYFTEETETARLTILSFLPILSICTCLNPPPCQCSSFDLSSVSLPFSPQKTRLQSPLTSADIHSVPLHKLYPPSLPSMAKLPQSTVTASPSLVPHPEFCPRTAEPTATVPSGN